MTLNNIAPTILMYKYLMGSCVEYNGRPIHRGAISRTQNKKFLNGTFKNKKIIYKNINSTYKLNYIPTNISISTKSGITKYGKFSIKVKFNNI